VCRNPFEAEALHRSLGKTQNRELIPALFNVSGVGDTRGKAAALEARVNGPRDCDVFAPVA
jgi:hypothetical protein